jgi:membrane-associated protein
MEFLTQAWDIITNLQSYLETWTDRYREAIYLLLFAIIFCETGLVVMPFLPGDSLLFTAGALCAPEVGKLNFWILFLILPIAAIIGDSLNYFIGRKLGPKVFSKDKSIFFNAEILHKTQLFYDKHGRKTVILARFIPLVRTFAPFVAGVGKMNYPVFLVNGILGAFIWVGVCAGAGYFVGNQPFVKKHFEVIILAVIFISILPAIIGFVQAKRESKRATQSAPEAGNL